MDPATFPVRNISGSFSRQTRPRRRADELMAQADVAGRFHDEGDEPPMYASSSGDAAWGELFRHTDPATVISPFEVRRRMSRLQIENLPVVDLTDIAVRRAFGVTATDLAANDYEVCQAIGRLARRAPGRFGGILAPSAAIRGEQTLAVFQGWLEHHVAIKEDHVTHPPPRLLGLFELIVDTLAARFREPLRQLAGRAQREWNRRA